MAYARKQATNNQFEPPFTTVPCYDISAHPCLQVIDIVFDNDMWCIVNFYHDIWDTSSLQALMNLDIDAMVPTLVVRDFNTHSSTWSPANVPRSSWVGQMEEWAATNLLTLANNPGEIMRRGAEHERDSVIDLAWFNEAVIQTHTFTNLRIDWGASLGSDHALLQIDGHLHDHTARPPMDTATGFLVDPDRKDEWIREFRKHSTPLPLPLSPTAEHVEQAAAVFTKDIQNTNKLIFRRR